MPFLDIHIVIIFNGTVENMDLLTQHLRKRYYCKVNFITLKRNYGYAGAIYIARSIYTTADLYLILNDDVEIPKMDTIFKLIQRMRYQSEIAGISPKVLNNKYKNVYDYAGAAGGFLDWVLTPFYRGRFFEFMLRDTYHDECSEVILLPGCFMVLRNLPETEVDPFLYIMHEEVEIGIKSLFKGYKLCVDCETKIYHRGSTTLGGIYTYKRMYYGYRNRIYLIMKYGSFQYMFKAMIMLLVQDFLIAIATSMLRSRTAIISWAKAYLSVLRNFKWILSRKYTHSNAEYRNGLDKLYRKRVLSRDLVVFRYFLWYARMVLRKKLKRIRHGILSLSKTP